VTITAKIVTITATIVAITAAAATITATTATITATTEMRCETAGATTKTAGGMVPEIAPEIKPIIVKGRTLWATTEGAILRKVEATATLQKIAEINRS